MNTVFFGASEYVIPTLTVLGKNSALKLIITTEFEAKDAVPNFALTHDIPYLSIKQFDDKTLEKIAAANAPVSVLAYFGLILPESVLTLFPKGIINIHPSLLPKHRGPTPVPATILADDQTTGVTIIKLDEEVDHGPILAQESFPVLPTDTQVTLLTKLFITGTGLVDRNLAAYVDGTLKPHEQNHKLATFSPHLTRDSGKIDIGSPPTKDVLDRMIRAYYPWPGVWGEIKLKNKNSRIKLLPGQMIQVEGKKPVNYKDFLNGYPDVSSELQKILKET